MNGRRVISSGLFSFQRRYIVSGCRCCYCYLLLKISRIAQKGGDLDLSLPLCNGAVPATRYGPFVLHLDRWLLVQNLGKDLVDNDHKMERLVHFAYGVGIDDSQEVLLPRRWIIAGEHNGKSIFCRSYVFQT